MDTLSKIPEIEIEGRKVSPSFNLALWEYTYELELKRFWLLVEKKAKRLKELKQIDLFELSEKESRNKYYQIKYLENELSDMIGLKEFTEHLKDAYLDTSIWLLEHFQRKSNEHLKKIELMKQDYQLLFEAYENASKGERTAIQVILAVCEEAKSKGLVIDSLKNTELWK